MSTLLITENQYDRLLNEEEWNYHVGSNHTMEPYVSDNKFVMFGRETGHFGSGTYFSTYKDNGSIAKNSEIGTNHNFIQVGEHLYRVDFDLYKNLYRVRSKVQGDILYTMMRCLNAFYNRISYMGEFKPKEASYDNATYYQTIRQNAEALNLDCPSYYQLTRMAQKHAQNKNAVQSFSTVFMEWNGFNGVNVSGVDYYDNTKHGSVIYDLSKVNTDMEEVKPKSLLTPFGHNPYDDTIALKNYDDPIANSLLGKDMWWRDKLNEMPIPKAMRLLKNYTDSGEVLNMYKIEELNPELSKRYLRFLYTKHPSNKWGDDLVERELMRNRNFINYLIDNNLLYWVNYPLSRQSMLIAFLDAYVYQMPWDVDEQTENQLKQEFLGKLRQNLNRNLTTDEEQYIEEEY